MMVLYRLSKGGLVRIRRNINGFIQTAHKFKKGVHIDDVDEFMNKSKT